MPSPRRTQRKAEAALVEQRVSLPIATDGRLKLAVVADTHSQPHPNTARLLTAEHPDAILHAGDIGDLAVLDKLRKIAPLFAVRGNIDERRADLPDVLELDLVSPEQDETARTLLKVLLLHIGVNGPRLRADAARLAQGKGAQLLICGHSHVPFIGRDRGISIFNPGSIGPRRFMLPIVFGVLELRAGKLQLAHIDCETGKQWTPP